MPQDYEILQFKKGDFQDNFGNYWCDMALKGFGEPVRIAVKDPAQFEAGQTLYGTIETKQSRAGKEYYKFNRQKKEDEPYGSQKSNTTSGKKDWQPRDDNAIRAQWSIGQAMTHFAAKEEVKLADVEKLAKALYVMVDRVKQDGIATEPDISPEELQARRETERDAERLRNTLQEDEVYMPVGEINLADIPF
jgi:hypothetical protein